MSTGNILEASEISTAWIYWSPQWPSIWLHHHIHTNHYFLFINLVVILNDLPGAIGRCSSSSKLCHCHLCWGLLSLQFRKRGFIVLNSMSIRTLPWVLEIYWKPLKYRHLYIPDSQQWSLWCLRLGSCTVLSWLYYLQVVDVPQTDKYIWAFTLWTSRWWMLPLPPIFDNPSCYGNLEPAHIYRNIYVSASYTTTTGEVARRWCHPPLNPLTTHIECTDNECTHHATLVPYYHLVQPIVKICLTLAKKMG